MNRITRSVLVGFTILMLATLGVLRATGEPRPVSTRNPADALPNRFLSAPDASADKGTPRANLLIIGASSLNAPVAQTQLVGAMLESKGIRMNIDGKYPQLDAVSRMLGSNQVWDYIVMDAWHFGRGPTDQGKGRASVPPDFPKAVAVFVKQVRDHSPTCKIILFPWWVPSGPKATNEGVMEVFHHCANAAKLNDIWVATTGPAFMEARLDRPDLHIVKSKTDAHPGIHGAYINACSLFTVITGQSPVGLPATLKLATRDFTIAPDDAKYLQELAWKVYQREIKNTKPVK